MALWLFFMLFSAVFAATWLLASLWRSLKHTRTRAKRLKNWKPPHKHKENNDD